MILHIETAANACSVAIGRSGDLIAVAEHQGQQHHASALPGLIEDCMRQAGLEMNALHAVAVSIKWYMVVHNSAQPAGRNFPVHVKLGRSL